MPAFWIELIVQSIAGLGSLFLGLFASLYAQKHWLSTDERKQMIPGGAEVPVFKSKLHLFVGLLIFVVVFLGSLSLLLLLIETYWFSIAR